MYEIYEAFSILSDSAMLIVAYALFYALFLYTRNLKFERARYSLALIEQLRLNEAASFNFRSASKEFLKCMEEGGLPEDQPEVLRRLSDLEALGLVIRKGIVDEVLIKEYLGRTILFAFRESKEMIYILRMANGRPEIYSDLEALALRWADLDVRHAGE